MTSQILFKPGLRFSKTEDLRLPGLRLIVMSSDHPQEVVEDCRQ